MGKTILTDTQKKVLQILSQDSLFSNNFYFTGGTVLAEYYLHHRYSEDLDFFSEKEIDKLWLAGLSKKFTDRSIHVSWISLVCECICDSYLNKEPWDILKLLHEK